MISTYAFQINNGPVVTNSVDPWRLDPVDDRSAVKRGIVPAARNDEHMLMLTAGIDVALPLFDITANAAAIG